MAHLVAMSLDDFQCLPQSVVPRTVRMRDPSLTSQDAADWIFIGYCEKLIEKNEPVANLLNKYHGGLDGNGFISHTTKGQRLLTHLAALDGQTRNGGITQFVWNYPEMILPTLDALEILGYEELMNSYQKVIAELESHADAWARLRNANPNDSEKMWTNFDVANKLINGNDFDEPYFDNLGAKARRMVIQYVNENADEFITDKC